MRRRTGLRSVVALGAAVTLLAGCGAGGDAGGSGNGATTGGEDATGSEPDAEGTFEYVDGMFGDQEAPGDPVDGGTLSYGAYAEPRSLDPAVSISAATTGGIEMASMYDTLLRYDSEAEDFVPQLAEGIEANDDSTEWTLSLREDVKFSDGSSLDAAAVKASQERYAAVPAPEAALWNDNVSSISTPDDTTVVYELQRPWGSFPAILSSGPGMIVAEAAGEVGEGFEPIGAGPFTLDTLRPGEELVMAANETYWNGRPHLDELRFVYLVEQTAVQDSLDSGGIQAAYFRDPNVADEVLEAGYAGYSSIVAASDVALINAAEGRPGEDPRVRKAMQLALDPEMVRSRVYDGHGLASPLNFPEYSRWYSEDVEVLESDPDAAKTLLDEAKADGYDGKVSILTYNSSTRRKSSQVMQAAFESVGFEVETNFLTTVGDQINAMAVEGDYDLSLWGLNFREADPFSKMFAVMHSKGAQTYGMATSDEMDAAIDALQAASDDEATSEAIAQIQSIWNDQVPYLNWMPFAELSAWNDEVHGIKGAANSMVLFDEAWVEQ